MKEQKPIKLKAVPPKKRGVPKMTNPPPPPPPKVKKKIVTDRGANANKNAERKSFSNKIPDRVTHESVIGMYGEDLIKEAYEEEFGKKPLFNYFIAVVIGLIVGVIIGKLS